MEIILHFVDSIILTMLEVYRDELLEAFENAQKQCKGRSRKAGITRLCTLLNASWYMGNGLHRWKNEKIFTRMDQGTTAKKQAARISESKLSSEIHAFSSLRKLVLEELCGTITQHIIKGQLRNYLQELSTTNISFVISPELTPTLSQACSNIYKTAEVIASNVAVNLHLDIAREAATVIDTMMLDVLLSSGGLNRDMIKAFTNDLKAGIEFSVTPLSQVPTTLYRRLEEALILLKLDAGTWTRLQSLLSQDSLKDDLKRELAGLGIETLRVEQTAQVIRLHLDHATISTPS